VDICLRSVVTFVCIIALACCNGVARNYPTNYIVLFVFTFAESYLVAMAASYYEAPSVVLAAGITFGITVGLMCFAFQTRYDFTTMGGLLMSLL
jgi:FtsH-binding integral membrane protein